MFRLINKKINFQLHTLYLEDCHPILWISHNVIHIMLVIALHCLLIVDVVLCINAPAHSIWYLLHDVASGSDIKL